jgi:hypothetical protein
MLILLLNIKLKKFLNKLNFKIISIILIFIVIIKKIKSGNKLIKN